MLLGIDALLVRDEIVVGLREHRAVLRVLQAECGLGILQDPLGGGIRRDVEIEDPAAAVAGIGVGVVDRPDESAAGGAGDR